MESVRRCSILHFWNESRYLLLGAFTQLLLFLGLLACGNLCESSLLAPAGFYPSASRKTRGLSCGKEAGSGSHWGGNKAHWIALLVLSVFKKPPSVICVSLGNMSERHVSIFRNGVPTN